VKLHLILGPTGVGKTACAVALAHARRVPVISLDRFQVFRDLATGTGRPTEAELEGTQRIYLADRRIEQGELPASEAHAALVECVERLASSGLDEVILEGGSLSLCALVFGNGLLTRYPCEIDHVAAPEFAIHATAIRRRVESMLAPPGGQASLFDELERWWERPTERAFLETIVGYDVLARVCREKATRPAKLGQSFDEAGLVEALAASHLAYARQQSGHFERLLAEHASTPRARSESQPAHTGVRPPEFDLSSPAALDDPYPMYAALREYAPAWYSAAIDAWVVSRYDDVVAVLKDTQRFSSAGVLKVKSEPPPEVQSILQRGVAYVRTLIDNDPPGHSRFRSLVNKAFVPARIQALESDIRAAADDLIDGFINAGAADLIADFAFPLPIYVITKILGLPRADAHDLKRWCDDWMALQSGTAPVDELVRCAHSYLAMQAYFKQRIEERTNVPQDDLLGALIQARVEGEAPLTQGELIRLLMSLLVAGHETTTHSIGNTVVLLAHHPQQQALLTHDASLAAQAFEEGLRMDPPVQSLFRRVVADASIAGTSIPAGARVMVLYGSANRDERHFEDPDRFDIRRASAAKHLAFSRGIHFCLGAHMARLEGRIALERLTQRLCGLTLDPVRRPERLSHFFLRGYRTLPVTWRVDSASGAAPLEHATVA
jgi:cytochrome P450